MMNWNTDTWKKCFVVITWIGVLIMMTYNLITCCNLYFSVDVQ